MTKEERREELAKQLNEADIDESLKALCFTIFDRTYGNGFADGVTKGLEQSAKLQSMIFDSMNVGG